MITGKLPFETGIDNYEKLLKEPVPYNPLLTDEAFNLICGLMEKDGKKRVDLNTAK